MSNDHLYDISLTQINGEHTTLAPYKGYVMLIVNVASSCGYTPCYSILQKLYESYQSQKFVVLGFPCNQFLHQEPKAEADIVHFCTTKYQITFPLFSKIRVNGRHTHPLYQQLKSKQPGPLGIQLIPWNFTKFLIDRHGRVTQRFLPSMHDEQRLHDAIQALL